MLETVGEHAQRAQRDVSAPLPQEVARRGPLISQSMCSGKSDVQARLFTCQVPSANDRFCAQSIDRTVAA
jgi:hypothetical protein